MGSLRGSRGPSAGEIGSVVGLLRAGVPGASVWRASPLLAMPMLVSGLVAGFVVGLAFGGNLRNLQTLELKLWPGLVVGAAARLIAP